MRYFFFLLGLVAFGFWIFFPKIFKWWVSGYLIDPPISFDAYASLGPIGDIFGGLTALFTSVTLIIVMYSAYLQRQANKDARKAMAEQLQQARDATAKQLRQARQSIQQQLELAQKTHDAQISESKFTNFSNAFYTLLNYKQSRLHALKIRTGEGEFSPEYIFLKMTIRFINLLENEWENENLKKLEVEHVADEYDYESNKVFGSTLVGVELVSYYLLYDDLFKLVEAADLTEEQQKFFRGIIFNSMTMSELYNLVWLSASIRELSVMVEQHAIFEKSDSDLLLPFINKFYEEKCLEKQFNKNI